MLSRLAHNAAYFFAEKNVIKKEDAEIYAYGYEILFSEAISWAIAIIIAIITKSILLTAVYMLSFMQLRESIGGFHAKTHIGCIVLSTVVYVACLWLVYITPVKLYLPIILIGLAVHNISVFSLAPVEHPNKPLADNEIKRYRKKGCILSVAYSVACVIRFRFLCIHKLYANMAGQEIEAVDGNGNRVYNTYDASGRLATKSAYLGTALSVTRYTYDANGNVVCESVTDNKPGEAETVRNTYMEYDCMDRLSRAWSDEEGETRYTYDEMGNVLTMATGITEDNPTGHVMSYEYDSVGRLIKTTDPMGKSETCTYDVMGNLATATDRNGAVATNTYNATGGILTNQIAKGDASDIITYTYTTGGLAKSMTDSESSVNYIYNAKGQVITETTSGVPQAVRNYTYDNDGNVSRVSITSGSTIYDMGYTYNPLGQMVTARDNIDNITAATYEYDGAGNISKETLANGVETTYVYNGLNALASKTNKKGSTVISSYNYSYYLDGNRSQVTENTGRVQSFVYDKNGRLSQESESINGQTITTGYTYDAFGNRISSTTTGAESSTTAYTYDANNRLVSKTRNEGEVSATSTYTYDDNGNLLSQLNGSYTNADGWGEETDLSLFSTGTAESTENASAIMYSYDLRNRLKSVSADTGFGAAYAYNVLGNRVQKSVNGAATNYVWNGGSIVYESGTANARYSYGAGLIGMKSGSNAYYYVSNGHGDITQLTNSSGTVAEDYAYDAFGNQKESEHSIYNPFRYCGEYFDSETGFVYLRNRYYDSSIGRFITEDPIRDGLNWYAYCANNPVMFVDPLGLKLTANTADSNIILRELQKLTDDKIEFVEEVDENGVGIGVGYFVITESYDTEKHVGQTLVADLINAPETVEIIIGLDYNGDTNTMYQADEYDPIQIFIDPDNTTGKGIFTTFVQDDNGNVLKEKIQSHIVFGHELVHAWRDIKNIFIPSTSEVGMIAQDSPKLWREEELQTMGINYTDVTGLSMRAYKSYNGIISENGLRIENGLNVRVSYYGW